MLHMKLLPFESVKVWPACGQNVAGRSIDVAVTRGCAYYYVRTIEGNDGDPSSHRRGADRPGLALSAWSANRTIRTHCNRRSAHGLGTASRSSWRHSSENPRTSTTQMPWPSSSNRSGESATSGKKSRAVSLHSLTLPRLSLCAALPNYVADRQRRHHSASCSTRLSRRGPFLATTIRTTSPTTTASASTGSESTRMKRSSLRRMEVHRLASKIEGMR